MAHGRVPDPALLYPLRLNVLRPPAKASLRSLPRATSAARSKRRRRADPGTRRRRWSWRCQAPPRLSFGARRVVWRWLRLAPRRGGAAGRAAHRPPSRSSCSTPLRWARRRGARRRVRAVRLDAQAVRRAASGRGGGRRRRANVCVARAPRLEEHDGGDDEPARAARAVRDSLERLLGALPPSTLVVLVDTGGEGAARRRRRAAAVSVAVSESVAPYVYSTTTGPFITHAASAASAAAGGGGSGAGAPGAVASSRCAATAARRSD